MTSAEVRRSFLSFFEERGHTVVPSASVIPFDDPTLLFTNAGMNQFKDVFLGIGTRSYTRAVDTQKCIRVSGKHNDLEEVGRDTYHHTFFEMLGNWSFGDYYKKEAIGWAWELLTKEWGIPKNRLWATVYRDDDEAESLWKKMTDIDPSHVLRFGEKDNFWEMGETGPCGPCSEIHLDRTSLGNATADMVNAGIADVMEVWNLVFIQYNRDARKQLTPLPSRHVDTGMGFERICAALQGKHSNYDTDVFTPIIRQLEDLSGRRYGGRVDQGMEVQHSESDTAFRVIADHIRALTFAIADGTLPSNEGRGYVLRRILRRAARFGRNLDLHEPFIYRLVSSIVDTMGESFPELSQKQDGVERVIHGEEEAFNATLDRGLQIFGEVAGKTSTASDKTIQAADAFRLYDTFGFPLDLTALLAKERGLRVDEHGFDELMEKQKVRSREHRKAVDEPEVSVGLERFDFKSLDELRTDFVGYEADDLQMRAEVKFCAVGNHYHAVVLDRTPFYVESGGQVDDLGQLFYKSRAMEVADVERRGTAVIHYVRNMPPFEGVEPGADIVASVAVARRIAIMRNHTATHIVHEALRRVLGSHAHQQGSLVAPDHLRFDFNHFERVTTDQLRAIEEMVNQKIQDNIPVVALNDPKEWVTIEAARKRWPNVKMFFGEKYGSKVRVVEIDPSFSVELCGGTHVKRTADIGYFKFRSEGSVASGIRRIEAVTGDRAVELLGIWNLDLVEKIEHGRTLAGEVKNLLDSADDAAATSNASRKQLDKELGVFEQVQRSIRGEKPALVEMLARRFDEQSERTRAVEGAVLTLSELKKSLMKQADRGRLRSLTKDVEELARSGVAVNGFRVVSQKVGAASLDELKALGDSLRSKLGSGVGLLAAVIDEKVSLVCVVTDDLVSSKKIEAGRVVSAVAKILGGGGGGKPHMATAGAKNAAKLDEAISQTMHIVKSLLHP